jgi:hypothetical protein
MIVAFDVDDTLIVPAVATGSGRDTPNYDTISIFRWHEAMGHKMVIWSGSGHDWATVWSEKLGLSAEIWVKRKHLDEYGVPLVDIAFDDCDVDLAKVNIKVKRIQNQISRRDWNKKKHITP